MWSIWWLYFLFIFAFSFLFICLFACCCCNYFREEIISSIGKGNIDMLGFYQGRLQWWRWKMEISLTWYFHNRTDASIGYFSAKLVILKLFEVIINSEKVCQVIQEELDEFESWSYRHGLNFSYTKYKFAHFRTHDVDLMTLQEVITGKGLNKYLNASYQSQGDYKLSMQWKLRRKKIKCNPQKCQARDFQKR